jgi:DNA-binding transcriptional LysR family regulator
VEGHVAEGAQHALAAHDGEHTRYLLKTRDLELIRDGHISTVLGRLSTFLEMLAAGAMIFIIPKLLWRVSQDGSNSL